MRELPWRGRQGQHTVILYSVSQLFCSLSTTLGHGIPLINEKQVCTGLLGADYVQKLHLNSSYVGNDVLLFVLLSELNLSIMIFA